MVQSIGQTHESRAMQELQHRKGSQTRDRILDVAEAAVLQKGFAATPLMN